MKLNTFLLIAFIIYSIFGLGRLFAPAAFFAYQGLTVNADGLMIARTKGAAIVGYAVMLWFARSAETSPALRAILLGNVVYIILEIILLVLGALPTYKIVASLPSLATEILLLIGFAYYYFRG